LSARRLWKLYRTEFAEHRRVRRASVAGVLALGIAVFFQPWLLLLLAVFLAGALAIGKSSLVDVVDPGDEADDWG
jgi:hypothetical protein